MFEVDGGFEHVPEEGTAVERVDAEGKARQVGELLGLVRFVRNESGSSGSNVGRKCRKFKSLERLEFIKEKVVELDRGEISLA
jgi:hypothetical protein